jgi:hypothetical protein
VAGFLLELVAGFVGIRKNPRTPGAGAIEHCQAARIATMPAYAKNRSITDADMTYRLFARSG